MANIFKSNNSSKFKKDILYGAFGGIISSGIAIFLAKLIFKDNSEFYQLLFIFIANFIYFWISENIRRIRHNKKNNELLKS